MARYRCSVCGVSAILIHENGEPTIIRPCGHDTAAVTVDVTARLAGRGGVRVTAPAEKAGG